MVAALKVVHSYEVERDYLHLIADLGNYMSVGMLQQYQLVVGTTVWVV